MIIVYTLFVFVGNVLGRGRLFDHQQPLIGRPITPYCIPVVGGTLASIACFELILTLRFTDEGRLSDHDQGTGLNFYWDWWFSQHDANSPPRLKSNPSFESKVEP
ncbi:hypothetical protein B0H14DRAFT_82219 [Mycena olivaceomarginata]|nr:hypothetical protein B0H14DRAFT_82219 [Mycena olivaceomarginata]